MRLAARQSRQGHLSHRVATLLLVAALHVFLIAIILSQPQRPERSSGAESARTYAFFIDAPSRQRSQEPRPIQQSIQPPEIKMLPPAFMMEPPVLDNSAISDPAAIDWTLDAKRTAARRVIEEETKRQLSERFAAPKNASTPGAKQSAANEFWDPAQVERVRPIEGGGLVVKLNDRCSIALIGLTLF